LRILAIDLGFNNVGYSLFEDDLLIDYGCIQRKKKKKGEAVTRVDFEAALFISRALSILIDNCDLVLFEMPLGSQSSRASRLLGMATGIMAGLVKDLKYDYVMPMELKKCLCLSDQRDISERMISMYGLIVAKKSELEHIADSMAVYYTWKNRKVGSYGIVSRLQ